MPTTPPNQAAYVVLGSFKTLEALGFQCTMRVLLYRHVQQELGLLKIYGWNYMR